MNDTGPTGPIDTVAILKELLECTLCIPVYEADIRDSIIAVEDWYVMHEGVTKCPVVLEDYDLPVYMPTDAHRVHGDLRWR